MGRSQKQSVGKIAPPSVHEEFYRKTVAMILSRGERSTIEDFYDGITNPRDGESTVRLIKGHVQYVEPGILSSMKMALENIEEKDGKAYNALAQRLLGRLNGDAGDTLAEIKAELRTQNPEDSSKFDFKKCNFRKEIIEETLNIYRKGGYIDHQDQAEFCAEQAHEGDLALA